MRPLPEPPRALGTADAPPPPPPPGQQVHGPCLAPSLAAPFLMAWVCSGFISMVIVHHSVYQ